MKRMASAMILAMMALVLLVLATGCEEKRVAATPQVFSELMVENGYAILDMTDQYKDQPILNVSIAVKKDYKIEYYQLPDEAKAINGFDANYASLKGQKAEGDQDQYKSKSNYSYFKRVSKDQYHVIIRIDNTIMFTTAPIAQKEVIDGAFEKIGYGF